jgi:alanine-glyoxylate transaminase / serine-glyoxylate transaminase / serine-pyruvate transaminase
MLVSERAIGVFQSRKAPPSTYFGSFGKWLPIMMKYEARQPSYFATPPVQLIMALEVSLKQFLAVGMDTRFKQHVEASKNIKDAATRLGMKLVPVSADIASNALSAIYYPSDINSGVLLKSMTAAGVVVAGGW